MASSNAFTLKNHNLYLAYRNRFGKARNGTKKSATVIWLLVKALYGIPENLNRLLYLLWSNGVRFAFCVLS